MAYWTGSERVRNDETAPSLATPRRAVICLALGLFATLRVLQNVAREVWNLPAEMRAVGRWQRGLRQTAEQHYQQRSWTRQNPGLRACDDWPEWPVC